MRGIGMKLRPGRRLFLRRLLPGAVGLVLGWVLAGYVTSSAQPEPAGPAGPGADQRAATQPAEEASKALDPSKQSGRNTGKDPTAK